MNILILGAFGREHALAQAYSKSKKVKKVYVAPGNDLMDYKNKKIKTCPNIPMLDFKKVLELCQRKKIDLVDVAQDDVVGAGFVNKLQEKGIIAFGPTQEAGEIEWNKDWARNFMMKYNLPIPHFKSFNNPKNAIAYIQSLPNQVLYIKASGLCGGKGAIRAETKQKAREAIYSMKQFGKAGETFLIEEALIGEEFSLFALCDGTKYKIVGWAQDHKTVLNADQGPNTGGMGCISPTNAVNKKILQEVEQKILNPFMKGMQLEKRPYSGILYLGGIITHSASFDFSQDKSSGQANAVKIIEFNARWGDPEAEVIIPSLQTDYIRIVEAVRNQNLHTIPISFDTNVRLSIAGCSRGYPNDYSEVKGKEIFGLQEALKLPGISIFGAGIKRKGNGFFANGGRIFHLVAEGNNIAQARLRAYGAMSLIHIEGNNLHFRTDIGWRDVERTNC